MLVFAIDIEKFDASARPSFIPKNFNNDNDSIIEKNGKNFTNTSSHAMKI